MALQVQLKAPNGVEFTLPTGLFINNEFVKSTSSQRITSISPSTGQEICSVEAASAQDIDRAVTAARAAFNSPSWRDISGGARGALMHKLADLIEQDQRVLATIETWDNGKPYSVSFNEDLNEVIGCLRYYAGWADKIHGQTIPTTTAKFAYTLKQPVGVDAGSALAAHPGINKIAFTGSTATGRDIMKTASIGMKNITLETGGKSPLLVFSDADIDQAAKWAYVGIMSNQGQVCTATSRLLVQESVVDAFVAAFLDVVKTSVVIGDPFAEQTTHGPQVSQAQYDKILSGSGYFIEPTVFSRVTPDMSVFREEVFGPLVTITPFADEADAVALANDSIYGLAAAVFSQNIERAHRVAAALEAGMVWVNSSNDSEIQVPFGGVKQSGIGRELGEAGLAAYTETKAVHVNLGSKL
ncbi:Aldehyde dehydrogenase [Metarhizium anisopliae BRIP 53293]|uniref:aldehyde dehydrogenase (NAD(+)) n=1 Tax=Metarhizium anisopliae BRIP 53293 TaxID=1291518 RepID=A0A0D9NWX9_METAN|nr:Aldehyde dehydrogenase [Metarhizium anisopliae BRIP 53293]